MKRNYGRVIVLLAAFCVVACSTTNNNVTNVTVASDGGDAGDTDAAEAADVEVSDAPLGIGRSDSGTEPDAQDAGACPGTAAPSSTSNDCSVASACESCGTGGFAYQCAGASRPAKIQGCAMGSHGGIAAVCCPAACVRYATRDAICNTATAGDSTFGYACPTDMNGTPIVTVACTSQGFDATKPSAYFCCKREL